MSSISVSSWLRTPAPTPLASPELPSRNFVVEPSLRNHVALAFKLSTTTGISLAGGATNFAHRNERIRRVTRMQVTTRPPADDMSLFPFFDFILISSLPPLLDSDPPLLCDFAWLEATLRRFSMFTEERVTADADMGVERGDDPL